MNNIIETLVDIPAEHESNVFGQFDEHIKKIERTLNVTLISRNGILKILGSKQHAGQAKRVFDQLMALSVQKNTITEQQVNYTLSLVLEEQEGSLAEMDKDCICHTVGGRAIKPKTLGQKQYVDTIRKKMIDRKSVV